MEGIARADTDIADTYRRFARIEAAGHSPGYEALCLGVADDPDVLALIGGLPLAKRQPNLLLAAARWHGAPIGAYPAFRDWVLYHWPALRQTMLERSTQTNEPARCAVLLPLLAALPGPLALLEVGASAGLCLYPDRFRYRYDDRPAFGPADAAATLDCRTTGAVPLPTQVPEIAWRAGIDLNPLDVRRDDDVRWLECLVWPEQTWRLPGLRAAVAAARAQPPLLVAGDLNQQLDALLTRVPAGATPVVFHTAVLAYLDQAGRDAFADRMAGFGGHWISHESAAVLPSIAARLPVPAPPGRFTLALDGRPVAFTLPHGQGIDWL